MKLPVVSRHVKARKTEPNVRFHMEASFFLLSNNARDQELEILQHGCIASTERCIESNSFGQQSAHLCRLLQLLG